MIERVPLTQAEIIELGKFSANQVNALGSNLVDVYDPKNHRIMSVEAQAALLGYTGEITNMQRVVPEGVDDAV